MGPRSRAEKDAATVETGYALVGACLFAAVTFGLFAAPLALWKMPRWGEDLLLSVGAVAAGAVAVAHLVRTLCRFRADRTERELQRLLRADDE